MTLYPYIQEHLFGKGSINEQQSQMSSFRIPNKASSLTPLPKDSVEPHSRDNVPPSCRPSLHPLQLIAVVFVSCQYMEALSPWKPSGQARPEMVSPLPLFHCKFSFLLSASNIQKHFLPRSPSGHIWQELRSVLYQAPHNHQTLLKSREINRKKEMKHPPIKDKNRYQHLESQLSQTQISRRQHKSTIVNTQDSMIAPEPTNSTIVDPERHSYIAGGDVNQYRHMEISVVIAHKDENRFTSASSYTTLGHIS